jgi:hypothetical protein
MGIYVLNTLLVPFLRAGLDLLVDGVADHETIDKVWRIFARAPEGPFQMIDLLDSIRPTTSRHPETRRRKPSANISGRTLSTAASSVSPPARASTRTTAASWIRPSSQPTKNSQGGAVMTKFNQNGLATSPE